MTLTTKFKDNAVVPIIAMDFDGTITQRNIYPHIADIRQYAREVINFLYHVGIKVVVWTCRDGGHEHKDRGDVMLWLHNHGIMYNGFNSSIQFAPFYYESRKIYAHMYVDDAAFGWNDHPEIMIDVLNTILHKYTKCTSEQKQLIVDTIKGGVDDDIQSVAQVMRQHVGL